MALGYAPYLLQHLKAVAADNAPETKVTPTGFLKLLLENNPLLQIPDFEKLRLSNGEGDVRQVQLKYLQRGLTSQTSTSDDCDNDLIPAYAETTLTAVTFRKISFYISDQDIALYEQDAAKTVALGLPPTPFMQEHITTLMSLVNGLVGAINIDLVGRVTFGKNVASGNSGNTATTLNIPLDATQHNLAQGIGKLLADAQQNEFAGMPLLAGGGLFNSFMHEKGFSSVGFNGINNAQALQQIKWYYDNYTQASSGAWGANNVGMFSKGSIGFVDLQKYIGFRAGTKGISTFFQISLPVMPAQNDGTADLMTFDAQLRYIDCPTEISTGYSTVTVNRGWQLIISKNYDLFQLPNDAYQTGDVLYGNNGALLYSITNA
jgi:hypothetical protein